MSNFSNSKVIAVGDEKIVIHLMGENYSKIQDREKQKQFRARVGKTILSRFKNKLPSIVEKAIKISSLNAVTYGDYYSILSEAIDSFILGHYKATIACCGIAAELIAFEVVVKIQDDTLGRKNFESMNQHSRLVVLLLIKKINVTTFKELDEIRRIRNLYIHNDVKKTASDEVNASICLNNLIKAIRAIYNPGG